MIKIDYHLEFVSDYHFGSGLGLAGVIDNALLRDGAGRDLIPGKTIKGMVRDACEDLLLAYEVNCCDGTLGKNKNGSRGHLCGINYQYAGINDDGEQICWLCALFGRYRHFKFTGGRRQSLINDLLADDGLSGFRQSMSRVEYHNKIDSNSKTARENMLYSIELGKKSSYADFSGSIIQTRSFDDDNNVTKQAITLLIAAMRYIDRVGGKRRRGKGKLRFAIDNISGLKEKWDTLLIKDNLKVILKPECKKAGD